MPWKKVRITLVEKCTAAFTSITQPILIAIFAIKQLPYTQGLKATLGVMLTLMLPSTMCWKGF
jgi:hypothetical protein